MKRLLKKSICLVLCPTKLARERFRSEARFLKNSSVRCENAPKASSEAPVASFLRPCNWSFLSSLNDSVE